jgi:hypothetical protein
MYEADADFFVGVSGCIGLEAAMIVRPIDLVPSPMAFTAVTLNSYEPPV